MIHPSLQIFLKQQQNPSLKIKIIKHQSICIEGMVEDDISEYKKKNKFLENIGG